MAECFIPGGTPVAIALPTLRSCRFREAWEMPRDERAS